MKVSGIGSGRFNPFAAESLGSAAGIRNRARPALARWLRVEFKTEAVQKQRTFGAVKCHAVRSVIRRSRQIVLLARRAPAAAMIVHHGGFVTQDEVRVLVGDLQRVGGFGAVFQLISPAGGDGG